MSEHKVIENPYWEDIYTMIDSWDNRVSIEQMQKRGLDLTDYTQVSAMGHKIYYYLAYQLMPLGNPWPDAYVTTFNNWLINGTPKDAAHQEALALAQQDRIKEAGLRVRKDITTLTEAETTLLKKAFQGLMDRDPKSPSDYQPENIKGPEDESYFSLAGKHWFPIPTFCQHHIYNYLPWHRFQMLDFEDALRSVPGCEEVTLPFWNIEAGNEFPSLLQEKLFASYTFPINVYPGAWYTPQTTIGKAGTTTQRNASLNNYDTIVECIHNARGANKWNLYNGISSDYQYDHSAHIIQAHDNGHNGTGPTMANQDIAAFDPIFWFFHCNWDRLWWEWQKSRNATDLDSFKEVLSPDDDQRWLLDPQMSISDPFGQHNYESIDVEKLGVTYDAPAVKPKVELPMLASRGLSWKNMHKARASSNTFRLSKQEQEQVSLRVKGINRIHISGSFDVILKIEGEEIGRSSFFQSTFSGNCENCVKQSRVDFAFLFNRNLLTDDDGNAKEVKVEVLNVITNKVMEFEDIGNPSINIRLLTDK